MDLSTAAGLLAFIQIHGYTIIFLIMLVEGILIAYVAGFAASLGYFNVYAVLFLSILANLFADLIFYFIGHLVRKKVIDKYLQQSRHLTPQRLKRLEESLRRHPGKTLTVIKLTPGLPPAGLILTGAINMPLGEFIFFALLIGVPFSLFLVLLGFYSGVAFNAIGEYFQIGGLVLAGFILLLLTIWFLTKKATTMLTRRLGRF